MNADPQTHPASWLSAMVHDIRLAARLLWRQPGYAAVAIATVALGVAAATVLFSVTYGVLLRPLPWRDPDRLVRLTETRPGGTNRLGSIMTSAPYVAWRDHAATIEGLAAWSTGRYTLAVGGEASRVRVAEVTAGLFPLLGVRPIVGGPFTSDDELLEQQAPLALSYGLWQERFGGRADIVGRTVELDGKTYRVSGVMPRSFAFPDRDTRAWIPLVVRVVPNGLSIFNAMARLKAGVTPGQAAAEGTALGRSAPDAGVVVMAVFGSRAPLEISAVPLLEAQTAPVRLAITVFLVAACLLLATATANVASIQLARGTARRREIAVRAALGAGGIGLLRQSLVESAVMCLSGGAVGLLLAGLLHGVIPLLLPPDFPRLTDVRVDLRVAAFAVLVSLVASVAPGLLFALQARRVDIVAALAEDGRAPAGAGARSRAGRMRALIISGQMAVACALLVGAALLTRSFGALLTADRGYDPANVLTAALPLPDARFTGAARATLMTTLLGRLHTVPGVTHAAFTTALPLTRGDALASFPVYSERAGATVQAQAMSRIVSPEYFAAIRVRLAEGRLFGDSDTAASNPVVIVNRAFARKYLDDRPVGRKLWADSNLGPGPEVIGVVEDVHHRSVTDPPAPEIYRSYAQSKDGIAADELALVLHTSVPAASLIPLLRGVVRDLDPSLALDSIAPMEDLLRASLAQPRLNSVLLGTFAALALAVAAVGLFGVLAYAVGQRSREIGVRTALGARPRDIVALVVRQGLMMVLAGLAAGLAVAAAFAKSLSALLYGVGPVRHGELSPGADHPGRRCRHGLLRAGAASRAPRSAPGAEGVASVLESRRERGIVEVVPHLQPRTTRWTRPAVAADGPWAD